MKEYKIDKGQTDWRPRTILAIFILILLTGTGYLAYNFHTEAPTTEAFQEVTIPEGKHSARPYWLNYQKRQTLHTQYLFTESVAYDLASVDQKDWNKLTGLSLHWWTNHKNSAMASWRWGLDCECVELGIYMHQDGERHILRNQAGSEVFATAKPGESIDVWIHLMEENEKDWIGVTIKTLTSYGYAEKEYNVDVTGRTRVINPWFGGSMPAPHNIYLYRRLVPLN